MIVFVRYRESVQRPGELTSSSELVLLCRSGESPLGGQGDDRVDPRVVRLDALQVRGHHLPRADLLGRAVHLDRADRRAPNASPVAM